MTKTNHGRGFHNQNGSSHHSVVESGVLLLMCKSFFSEVFKWLVINVESMLVDHFKVM